MMLNSKSIGNKIASARKKSNLTQAELARLVFVSPQAVGKWERGESMPDITTLNRLAEILGLDLNYFSETFHSVDQESKTPESLEKQLAEPAQSEPIKKPVWDMSQGNWVDADFSGLKNLKGKFSSSNMKNCRFANSELSGLLLKSNHVEHCDFSGSDISKSIIENSYLSGNIFKDCSLKDAEFSACDIKNCNLTGADFTGTKFHSVHLRGNTLESALWNSTIFKNTQFTDIVFSGTLEDCSFENCSFSKVTFRNSNLINTFFKCKHLKRIQFINCEADRMTYGFLKSGKADLTGITV